MKRPTCAAAMVMAVLASGASSVRSGEMDKAPARKSACALLTTADVTEVAGAESPRFDDAASGEIPAGTEDYCVWVGKSQPDPLVQMVVSLFAPEESAELHFTVTCGDYFGGGPEPAVVKGLGDEARYRDFIQGKGGTVVVRKGRSVFALTGLLSKDTLVSLAKKAAGRLP